MGFRYEKSKDQ